MAVITNAPAIGWRGYLKVDAKDADAATGYYYPFNSEDITRKIGLIRNDGINGGISFLDALLNAGRNVSRVNISRGRTAIDGSIGGEVFGGIGNFGKAFKNIIQHTIGETPDDSKMRTLGYTKDKCLIVSPGGGTEWLFPGSNANEHNDRCAISSLRLSGNIGGVVTMEVGVISSNVEYKNTINNKPTTDKFEYEIAAQNIPTGDDDNPLPFWGCTLVFDWVKLKEDLTNKIVGWTLEINNNSSVQYTLGIGSFPRDVYQGMMIVTGSISYYKPAGDFIEAMGDGSTFQLTLGGLVTLKSDYIVTENSVLPSPEINVPAVRTFNFECLATDDKPSLYLV